MPNYISNNAGYEIDSMIDYYLSFRKTIKVMSPENSVIIVTYTFSGETKNIPGFKYYNYTLFFPKDYGEYTVYCHYGNTTRSEVLDVDSIQIYEVVFD